MQKAKKVQSETVCLNWTVWTVLAWLGRSREKPYLQLICRAILGFSFSAFNFNICSCLPTSCTNFFALLEQWLIASCEGKYLNMCTGKLFPPKLIVSSTIKSLVFVCEISHVFLPYFSLLFLSSVRDQRLTNSDFRSNACMEKPDRLSYSSCLKNLGWLSHKVWQIGCMICVFWRVLLTCRY